MKKAIILAIGMIFIIGCQNTKPTQPSQKTSPEIMVNHCNLNLFTSIVVGGNAKVELVNGSYGIDITGTQKDTCPSKVVNQVLYINNTTNSTPDTLIKISMPTLRKIVATNNATVSAQNFKTSCLTITAKDYGAINLEGRFKINKIFQFGRGRINIDWIDSNSLIVEGYDHGPIYLAGRVNNLMVKLAKDAKFYAHYLRTQKANVFTTDNATAEILVFDTLGAFAVDRSSIYYYKKPKNITIVTRDHGNVLYPYGVR